MCDDFSPCRRLLRRAGHPHLNPREIECDPVSGHSACPACDQCQEFLAERDWWQAKRNRRRLPRCQQS